MLCWFLALAALADDVRRDRPGEVMPDRSWDFQHLDLAVDIDFDAGIVRGTATHTLAPLGRPDSWVRMHQIALDVERIEVDGQPVEGFRMGRQTLDIPVAPGKPHTIAIRYVARPQTGMHFRGGAGPTPDTYREAWTQGEDQDNRHWFPGWDYPNDTFTLSTAITVPEGITALSNGVRKGVETTDGRTTWRYALEQPIVNYLVAVTAGDYVVLEDKAGDTDLAFVAGKGTDPEAMRRTMAGVGDQLAYFNDLLGTPYPYPNYRQVLVQRFIYGGMENATLTVLRDSLLVEEERQFLRSESTVAHELAHQWFGDLLTCYGWRHLWLNEGFATFYAGRWQEHVHGPEYAAVYMDWRLNHAPGGKSPMSPQGWSQVGKTQNAHVYTRGSSVLHMLRVHLGDDVFDAAIRRYVDDNQFRLVQTADLRRVLEDVSGEHLGWLFDQYVHGAGAPKVKTKHSWKDGQLTVVLNQTTKGTAFSAPVRVEIGTRTGAMERTLWLDAGTTRLVIDLPEAPQWVAVDPRRGVIGTWTHEQSPTEWVAQLEHSGHPTARITAMRALGDLEGPPDIVVDALAAELADVRHHPRYRQFAADALGKLATPAATDALLAATRDPDPHVRERAVDALGQGIGPDDVLQRLRSLAKSDDDGVVRISAVQALVLLGDEGLPLARKALTADDGLGHPVRRAAVGILGDHGEDKDVARLVALTQPEHPKRVRTSAAWALTRLVKEHDADIDDVSDALAAMLDSDDVDTRSTAIATLGRAGTEGAVAPLRVFAKRNNVVDPDLSQSARDAISRIRKRLSGEPDTPDTKEDAENDPTVEDRLRELEQRLERLEEWR